jgi:hypothetical protein
LESTALQAFISKVLASRRLLYADLRRLRRDVLPNGLASHSDAEALIGLAGLLDRVDEGWPAYLSVAVREFVLSSSHPPGTVDHTTAAWLVSALTKLPRNAAVALAREVTLDAQQVDNALLVFVGNSSKERLKVRPTAPLREWSEAGTSGWPGQRVVRGGHFRLAGAGL